MFEARGEVMPEGYTEGFGLPISVVVVIVVAIVMTIIALRTRFGRYIFAAGGNPDAAELSGINTRWLTVKVFALMGILCGLSAVIGGTALSGGVGTIYGAILGALIMQSLQSGMAMVGAEAPFQNIVVGVVLVLAVWLDIQYRKRTGALK